ncbi:MAG: lysine--tRNA ligase [Chloracidobacterium sp.]|nr:lysine--tRNA ligase [Chloracidobacterium sp.]
MQIPEFTEIVQTNDQTQARAEHLEALRALVGNAYPNRFARSQISGREDSITSLLSFAPVAAAAAEMAEARASLPEGQRPPAEIKDAVNERLKAVGSVRIAGRLTTPPRGNFVHLTDGMGKLQIYCKKGQFALVKNDADNTLDEENAWPAWQLIDHGDFVGVEGYLFVTNTGEVSVHVEKLQFLAKAMLPMPDKMHGIEDPEIKQRQRYVDLIGSSLAVEHEGMTTREVFETRAKVISSMRNFLEDHGYIEVETPMLTPKATGAAAKPFVTHHNALDITLYARIAPELYLKRLVVGGFEKVYELNRNFRNEGISYKHNPEFTMLEFYCAYMDVNGMMDFCEELMRQSVQKATGGLTVEYEGQQIDFSKFERVSMLEVILRYLPVPDGKKVDLTWFDDNEKLATLYHVGIGTSLGREGENRPAADVPGFQPRTAAEIWNDVPTKPSTSLNRNEVIVFLFEKVVEPNLVQPTFIVDFPKSISPLSKASPEDPRIAERFELFINGMEVANGFSELNDPREQYERFVDQMAERERGDEEAMVMDEDYIRALSYGMPPAAGIGIGIDRLVMLLTNRHSIRDVILFPHMRPEKREGEKGSGGDEESEN